MIHLHVDVDNLWVYEHEYGISIHPNPEYIYVQALPELLQLLHRYHLHATFFVIGQDLLLPACQKFCRQAVSQGHQIGNHTWSHPILFSTLSKTEKRKEVGLAHLAISKVCGTAPRIFRGPGYYQDADIIDFLQKLHYRYDSSVLPGWAALIMKLYSLIQGGANRHKAFGRVGYLWASTQPWVVSTNPKRPPVLELPLSILPVIRLPVHTTFAYFFGPHYKHWILQYLKNQPQHLVYTFHAIDFVDVPRQPTNYPIIPLRFSHQERLEFANQILTQLGGY